MPSVQFGCIVSFFSLTCESSSLNLLISKISISFIIVAYKLVVGLGTTICQANDFDSAQGDMVFFSC